MCNRVAGKISLSKTFQIQPKGRSLLMIPMIPAVFSGVGTSAVQVCSTTETIIYMVIDVASISS